MAARAHGLGRQPGLFDAVARMSADVPAPEFGQDGELRSAPGLDPATLAVSAFAAATGFVGARPAGPVQLNLAFREPLSGTAGFDAMIAAGSVITEDVPAEALALGRARQEVKPGLGFRIMERLRAAKAAKAAKAAARTTEANA